MQNILSNLHTHSTFCDGKNSPEEVVNKAIEKNFHSLGFSSHGYTSFDLRYCMQDTEGYIAEINRLKSKYKDKIEIYLGVEEDAFMPVDRNKFEYIIGSCHYYLVNGTYYPIDSSPAHFQKCLEVFAYDAVAMANAYYPVFCDYIAKRKPDIIGHFDLITKFDEMGKNSLFLQNAKYNEIAKKYALIAAQSGCLFEVNTGAISRGYRTKPYPNEDLLYALKQEDAKLILSSDSHQVEMLDSYFEETKKYLWDIGFRKIYALLGGKFQPYSLR